MSEGLQEFSGSLHHAYNQFNKNFLEDDNTPTDTEYLQLESTVEVKEKSKTNLLDNGIPEDNMFVQMNEDNKFLGTLMYKFFDFISFGALEKRAASHDKKEKATSTDHKNQKPLNNSNVLLHKEQVKTVQNIESSKMEKKVSTAEKIKQAVESSGVITQSEQNTKDQNV